MFRKKETGLTKRLLQFQLEDPEPLLYHNEPILRDGKIVGALTSGAYGHYLGSAIGLGYVPTQPSETAEELLASRYAIYIAGKLVPARTGLAPLYNPKAERMRA